MTYACWQPTSSKTGACRSRSRGNGYFIPSIVSASIGSIGWHVCCAATQRSTPEVRHEDAPAQDGAPARSLRQTFRRHYLGLIHIPDMRADWVRTAIPAGRQLIKEWKPDIIFASAPPNTGLIVASRLARAHKVPWVADFRDLWVDNPYYSEPGWRKRIDAILERRILRGAAGLVTVSPIWAEQLRRRHGKDVTVVYNGYAEEDFPPLARRPGRRPTPGEV